MAISGMTKIVGEFTSGQENQDALVDLLSALKELLAFVKEPMQHTVNAMDVNELVKTVNTREFEQTIFSADQSQNQSTDGVLITQLKKEVAFDLREVVAKTTGTSDAMVMITNTPQRY